MKKILNKTEENEYKFNRLGKVLTQKTDDNIAIYGIGINAKRCLDRFGEERFVGLVDSKAVGTYVYGKKVLSDDEIILLNVKVIVIAAEPAPTNIICNRILSFCLKNRIEILDLYGNNLIQFHRFIKQHEINYDNLTVENVNKHILNKQDIFVCFSDVICSLNNDQNLILNQTRDILVDWGIPVHDFIDMRIKAQNKIVGKQKNNINVIYDYFTTMSNIDSSLSSQYVNAECEAIKNNSYPRDKMLQILKKAEKNGARIYVCCDILGCEETATLLMKKYKIDNYSLVSVKNDIELAELYMLVHSITDDGNENSLFLGNKLEHLMIPLCYGIDYIYIKSAEQIFGDYVEQSKDFYPLSDRERVLIYENLDSPFVQDIDKKKFTSKIMGPQKLMGELYTKKLDILPPVEPNGVNLDSLVFPKFDSVEVSIIIPVYNQFSYTYNCLKSILRCSAGVNYEVIIADDCSTDLTKDLDKYVKGINVIHNTDNLRFLLNCNNAAKYAAGKYILFLNNDTQVQKNWLKSLLKTFELHVDAGLVGSKLLNEDGTLQEAGGIIWNDAGAMNYGRGGWPDSCEYSYVREVDYISGASIIIPKKLWEEIGGFDERYIPSYCEDSDLAFEVRKRGKKVYYQPESEVIHFEGISNGRDINTGIKSYQAVNQLKLRDKWKQELIKSHCQHGDKSIAACDRKLTRKCVLIISHTVPFYDMDAGSRTIMMYIEEFIKRNYLIKYIPNTFKADEPYSYMLKQMGIEVFSGPYFEKNMKRWIAENAKDIEFAFLNYPDPAYNFIDVLKENSIKTIYYGMDLHYIRSRRENDLLGKGMEMNETNRCYEIEKYVITNSDVVYYPSVEEVNIVKKEFGKDNVKCLPVFAYDTKKNKTSYNPVTRDGIFFVGGFGHRPNLDGILWFLNNIYGKVYKNLNVDFYIAGSNMPSEILNIKEPGVKILGAISDNKLSEMYKKVKMVVVPLRFGAGIKGKIIEAMYKGVPIVTTSIGAEGVPNDNDSLIVADTEEDYADKIISLYHDNERLQTISDDFKRIVDKYYSREAAWNTIKEDFE